jgi:hypothetical protein
MSRKYHYPIRVLLIVSSILLITSCANIDTQAVFEAISGSTVLDEATVAAGLREALEVGTDRTVAGTSTVDGFLGNALIRIALPEEFDEMASLLRGIGFDDEVDDMEIAMNRAAERASGEARDVFWDSIRSMSIADAFGILRGPDDAATNYFRQHTESELRARFSPIVQNKMTEVGLYRIYEELSGYYERLPFVEKPAIDLEQYITDSALEGLFTVLAQEEASIRKDPLARSTDLLRRVFSSL